MTKKGVPCPACGRTATGIISTDHAVMEDGQVPIVGAWACLNCGHQWITGLVLDMADVLREVPEYVAMCKGCGLALAEVTYITWKVNRDGRESVLYVMECDCGWADARRVIPGSLRETTEDPTR